MDTIEIFHIRIKGILEWLYNHTIYGYTWLPNNVELLAGMGLVLSSLLVYSVIHTLAIGLAI